MKRRGDRLSIASDVSHRRSHASKSGTSRTRTGCAPDGVSGSRGSAAGTDIERAVWIVKYRSGTRDVRGDRPTGSKEIIYRTVRAAVHSVTASRACDIRGTRGSRGSGRPGHEYGRAAAWGGAYLRGCRGRASGERGPPP